MKQGQAKKPLADGSLNDSRLASIRERAYEIWEQRGRPVGQDLEHWLEAERELGEAGASRAPANPTLAASERASSRTRRARTPRAPTSTAPKRPRATTTTKRRDREETRGPRPQ